jgi:hypothetical protein
VAPFFSGKSRETFLPREKALKSQQRSIEDTGMVTMVRFSDDLTMGLKRGGRYSP